MEIQGESRGKSDVSSDIYAPAHGAISGESCTEFLCHRKNG
ncbi:hypothetical protein PC116_g12321 [Phytophthora cactorum]|uniref:Uncharacterized protein n=1 Tax=Phytophthora cactorum TaxID=29920 RepID=A0A8T1DFP1_9STRA|nr:hypothetical protein PC117_g11141 [Phytophthora cactorum]KAG4239689.1 hypothetical protein PC116_g12321 [Phytophthora cactorum]